MQRREEKPRWSLVAEEAELRVQGDEGSENSQNSVLGAGGLRAAQREPQVSAEAPPSRAKHPTE